MIISTTAYCAHCAHLEQITIVTMATRLAQTADGNTARVLMACGHHASVVMSSNNIDAVRKGAA